MTEVAPLEASWVSRWMRRLIGGRTGALPQSATTALSLLATLVIVAILILVIGSNPWEAAKAIVQGSLGSQFFLGQTLMIGAILTLTGLAAALPFTARLWNVGGEGQMFAGAIVAVALGIELPAETPRLLFVVAVVAGSFVGGALWGLIPGALKAWFGASEIVTTLMLNFVAVFVAGYVISDIWPDPFSQKTVAIADNARLPEFWGAAQVDVGLLLAIGAAVVAWLLMSRTALGFSVRAIGANPKASRLAGVRTERVTILVFVIAGGLAGLAGSIAVAGIFDDLDLNFSSNFGFIGIAVALLARLDPRLVVPAAFLFSMLRVGSNSLQASAGISPSLGDILVALFVILLMVTGAISFRYAENVAD